MRIDDAMELFDDKIKCIFNLLEINNKKFDFFDIISPKEVLVSK